MSDVDEDDNDKPSAESPRKRKRRKKHGIWWNRMEYAALAGGAGILKFLPHGFASAVGLRAGIFYGWLCRTLKMRDHKVATKNLELAYPEKSPAERDQMLRAMWRSWGRFGGDCTQLLKLSPQRIREIVKIDPIDNYLEIQENIKKRGVLILTAHFGSFELLHAAVSAYGAPVTLVHRPMANPLADDWIRKLRLRFGTQVLARGHAAREVMRELRSGRMVAIPFDQTARKHTRVFAPFFGIETSTNSGLARLAVASGAPVYPAVLVREGESLHHKVWIGPRIELVKTRDREADILVNTRKFNKVLEDMIRAHPDHWIWMYRRFKQQPDEKCSPYHDWSPPAQAYRIAAANS